LDRAIERLRRFRLNASRSKVFPHLIFLGLIFLELIFLEQQI